MPIDNQNTKNLYKTNYINTQEKLDKIGFSMGEVTNQLTMVNDRLLILNNFFEQTVFQLYEILNLLKSPLQVQP